jgi:uncharacterized protein (TIGR03435 family)
MSGRRLPVVAVLGLMAMLAPTEARQKDTFEAASIIPGDATFGIDFRFLPSRFVATAVTLGQLIEQAYELEFREVIGGPLWLREDRFNVTATAGENMEPARMRRMLQSLLADRFQLQLTREVRTGTVYTLTARAVRDLRAPADPKARPLVSTIRDDRNGFLSYRYDGRNATMATLAQSLAAQLRAPVTDATNLTGNYDFSIKWAYESAFFGLEPDPDVPTIFTALESQVGLKLVAGSGPVPVHVVTRATKPTPN